MLGPGNDSGDPGAILEAGYDSLMSHLAVAPGQPLTGIIALSVEDEYGDRGLFLWKYGMVKPSVCMSAVSDDPLERLTAIGGAVECAGIVAEREGLTLAGS